MDRDGALSTTTYGNAPLLELIVEIRWAVNTTALPGAPSFITDKSAVFDQWFNRFSNQLEELGYRNLERLLPHDFPPAAHQPVFRYKKKRDSTFPIIQFGHGIFTMNAGPPDYISWEIFRPEVEAGIEALIAAKPSANGPEKFMSTMVRYIDAFRENLREGKSNYSFMKTDLQAALQLPIGIFELAANEDAIVPTMAVRFPVKDNESSQLTLQVAAGQVNKESATIMDLSYLNEQPVTTQTADVLTELDISQKTLHSTFEMMTVQLHDRMKPALRVKE